MSEIIVHAAAIVFALVMVSGVAALGVIPAGGGTAGSVVTLEAIQEAFRAAA
jgi:hypothetical protein